MDTGRKVRDRGHKVQSMILAGWAILLLMLSAAAHQSDFASWLRALRAEALRLGVRAATLDAALTGLQPLPRVIELDRKQLEFTLTYTQYVQRVLPDTRLRRGRHLLNEHRALLDEISTTYGVQPRFIVALWGIESDYGRTTGGFSVLGALATLAYDGRRSTLFRRELLHALRIVDEGHVSPKGMVGSWAGAMGQNQFMPSSFRQYAVDVDGDGRRDIWTTLADVFGSTANYLARAGWRKQETWGCQATIPATFDTSKAGLQVRKSLAAWRTLGVRPARCRESPDALRRASLILLDDPEAPAFLVYDNYRTLLKWNRSTYFVLAVGQLADHLGGG